MSMNGISAILIGFRYNNTNSIIGTIIDLYIAYKYCQTIGCGDIYIFSDIENISGRNIPDAVINDIVDINIMHFMDHQKYSMVVQDRQGLLDNLKKINISPRENKLLVYYTGHGTQDAICLPSDEKLSIAMFRDTILSICQPDSEIFWIMDCCHSNGLYLPYYYDTIHSEYRLANYHRCYITNKVFLITSSNKDEKAVATEYGSLFTRFLFKTLHGSLTRRKWNIGAIIDEITKKIREKKTGYTQSVSVYSSYIMSSVIWGWLWGDGKYIVDYDEKYKYLKIIERKIKPIQMAIDDLD